MRNRSSWLASRGRILAALGAALVLAACGPAEDGGAGGGGAADGGGGAGDGGGSPDARVQGDGPPGCVPRTCAELGWACGTLVTCGQVHDCAEEGLTCAPGEVCQGGIAAPTQCASPFGSCSVCAGIPDCSGQPQVTRLTGRVLTPGRTDADTGNQVGVPNALVYILRDDAVSALPTIPSGLPTGGSRCDRCEDQAPLLGPVLAGSITDATGRYTIEGNIPVGTDFLLVVKAGKFRRATVVNLSASEACTTVALPEAAGTNPTRLPRSLDDGLAVHFPQIGVSTGQIDAMECVLEKIGITHGEFGNDGSAAHVHLYRGGSSASPAGTRINDATPHDQVLYGDLGRLERYDLVVADCEGGSWDVSYAQRDAFGDHVREYVNRGGRLFASHLSFSWLNGNGIFGYSAANPVATGLGPAAFWQSDANATLGSGTGIVALGRPFASPRIEHFAAWMASEGVASAPGYQFAISEPRSQVLWLGSDSEEFVHCAGGECTGLYARTQQFSFDTPYGAPAGETCGRVAYSGFHVVAGGGSSPYGNTVFPAGCSGALTSQEKVLLYMLFDLGTCLGDPLPPPCVPITCEGGTCGYAPNGCGGILDCGPCGGVD